MSPPPCIWHIEGEKRGVKETDVVLELTVSDNGRILCGLVELTVLEDDGFFRIFAVVDFLQFFSFSTGLGRFSNGIDGCGQ